MELMNEENIILDTVSEFICETWRKKDEILNHLKAKGVDVSERKWRKFTQEFNRKYQSGTSDVMIAHSYQGYKLTVDYKEANKSALDNFKRGITLINEAKKVWKSSSERNQLNLDLDVLNDEEKEIYSIVMGMNSNG